MKKKFKESDIYEYLIKLIRITNKWELKEAISPNQDLGREI